MKRLSRISKEFNAKISDIADFLMEYGYDCSDDPNEEISFDAYETIKYNLNAFLSEKKKLHQIQDNIHKKPKEGIQPSIEQTPLELKIVEEASKEKKLIERIIGFTDFEWSYKVKKYHGVCSQPVDFNLFDEVFCELLLTEEMSLDKIGNILGFNINQDPAEREIVFNKIKDLKKDKMLEGDESVVWLTDIGKEYAKNGVKFSTFDRDFELYFDSFGDIIKNAKNIFSRIKSEKVSDSTTEQDLDLEEIKQIAQFQAPEIHFPDKGFHLQSASLIESEVYKAKIWVILLENFRDNSLRSLVYDEKQNKIIDELSEALNQQDNIKIELLNKLIKLDESPVETTEEDKSNEQIENEKHLINKQKEIDTAFDNNETEKVLYIQKEVEKLKRHFNSLEFEVELKRLFDETSDDLWIISPWIKNAALKRIPFFEKYIKKGGRIFIGYSEPEEEGQIMAYEQPLNKLLELEKKYPNYFFLHQLPVFHYKNVWLISKNQNHLYYTGSYNILSFFVSQGLHKVRQEKMTRLDWNDEVQKEYIDVLLQFGKLYENRTIKEFNLLCQNPPKLIDRAFLQKIKKFEDLKLKPFINQGIPELDKTYKEIEKTKELKVNYFRRIFFEQKIEEFKQQINLYSDKPISPEKKRAIKNEFEKLRDEFLDYMDLQVRASAITDMIEGLRVFSFQNKSNFKQKRK